MKELYWNFLTILVLIAAVLVVGIVGILFGNPYIEWNPFPPPPLPERLVLPTATPTYLQLPPTWTFTPEAIEATPTLLPSSTAEPTATTLILPSIPDTETPTETATNTATFRVVPTRTRTPTSTNEPPAPPPPPKPTNTPVPPTNTPEPPTDTPPPPPPTEPA